VSGSASAGAGGSVGVRGNDSCSASVSESVRARACGGAPSYAASVDLRLRNLEQLDDRAVPLPHGAEVVTRVDRIVGERRVPQGSVGRVTKVDGEELDVTIVGVGVVHRSLAGHRADRR
jgi:hypothetical protein